MGSVLGAIGAGFALVVVMWVVHRLRRAAHPPEPASGLRLGPPVRVVREPEPGREATAQDERDWRSYAAELLGEDLLRFDVDVDVERRRPL